MYRVGPETSETSETSEKKQYLWLGASDEEKEGEWHWLDGGAMLLYERQEVGGATEEVYQPFDYEGHRWFEDNLGGWEHFLGLVDFKTHRQWRDISSPLAYFVCEWIYQ